jgi:uncharacterized membrane protein
MVGALWTLTLLISHPQSTSSRLLFLLCSFHISSILSSFAKFIHHIHLPLYLIVIHPIYLPFFFHSGTIFSHGYDLERISLFLIGISVCFIYLIDLLCISTPCRIFHLPFLVTLEATNFILYPAPIVYT